VTEEELFVGFDAWLQQQSGNETVQTLDPMQMAEGHAALG
jgi:hypothetical protein